MQRSNAANKRNLHRAKRIVFSSAMALTLGAVLLLSSPAQAAKQFSQQECQTLNNERRNVRKQLSQPYQAAEGKALQQREQELHKLLSRHCRKPVPDKAGTPAQRKASDSDSAGRDGKAGQANKLL